MASEKFWRRGTGSLHLETMARARKEKRKKRKKKSKGSTAEIGGTDPPKRLPLRRLPPPPPETQTADEQLESIEEGVETVKSKVRGGQASGEQGERRSSTPMIRIEVE